jgi:subtilase family serine protease
MTVLHSWAQPGTYTVRLKVTDPQGASDSEPLSIRIRPSRDLVVPEVRFENIGTGASRRVKIIAKVLNNGFAPATASKTQFLLDGATVLGNVTTKWLASKEQVEVSVIWDARSRPGNHTIKVIADQPNTVPESYENNNTRSRTFRIVNGRVE